MGRHRRPDPLRAALLDVRRLLLVVARRIDLRPEDRPDAEIIEGAGEIGFFSPGSYWPFGLALSARSSGLGLVFWMWWLIVLGLALTVISARRRSSSSTTRAPAGPPSTDPVPRGKGGADGSPFRMSRQVAAEPVDDRLEARDPVRRQAGAGQLMPLAREQQHLDRRAAALRAGEQPLALLDRARQSCSEWMMSSGTPIRSAWLSGDCRRCPARSGPYRLSAKNQPMSDEPVKLSMAFTARSRDRGPEPVALVGGEPRGHVAAVRPAQHADPAGVEVALGREHMRPAAAMKVDADRAPTSPMIARPWACP